MGQGWGSEPIPHSAYPTFYLNVLPCGEKFLKSTVYQLLKTTISTEISIEGDMRQKQKNDDVIKFRHLTYVP